MKSKNVLTIIALFAMVSVSIAQTKNSDTIKIIRFGFNIGTNYSILQSKNPLGNVKILNGLGYNLGIFMDCPISKNITISPRSEFTINSSSVKFANDTSDSYDIFPVSFDLKTYALYKISSNKTTSYFFTGPHYRHPISNKSISSSNFKTNPDIAIDIGIGVEYKIKNFTIAPELIYSWGLLNVNRNPFLQNLYFHNISLILNFK